MNPRFDNEGRSKDREVEDSEVGRDQMGEKRGDHLGGLPVLKGTLRPSAVPCH